MEEKQFGKIEQWFSHLNQKVDERIDGLSEQIIDIRQGMNSLATKQQLENRFDLLATSMRNVYDRMGRVEERFGNQDMEVIILKLAVKKLEDDVEILRQRIH